MPRGKRPPRAAVANSTAINNVLLGKRNIGPTLRAAAANLPGPSSAPSFAPAHPRARLGRPHPSGGIGVKNVDHFRRRPRNIKINKLLPQPRVVNVKKNGVVVRKMTVRRKTYFPGGKRRKIY